MTCHRLAPAIALALSVLLTPALTVSAPTDGPNPSQTESRGVFSDISTELSAGGLRRTPEEWRTLVLKVESRNRAINDEFNALVLRICTSIAASSEATSDLQTLRDEYRARKELMTGLAKLVLIGQHLDAQTKMELLPFLNIDLASLKGKELALTRTQLATLWLDTWREVDSVVKGFDFGDPPVMNVPAPGATTPGASPDTIKDPEIRRQYDAAVAANDAKGERRNHMYMFALKANGFFMRAERAITGFYRVKPYDNEELARLLEVYVSNRETRERMLSVVREHTGPLPTHKAAGDVNAGPNAAK